MAGAVLEPEHGGTAALPAMPAPTALAALIAANPFPGLRAFKPSEADRFFGRQQQIDALVARLASSPLVAVAGASGCGKSSLVLAGLLNELARQHAADDDATAWVPVVMRPGQRPMAHLALQLAGSLPVPPGGVQDQPPATASGDGTANAVSGSSDTGADADAVPPNLLLDPPPDAAADPPPNPPPDAAADLALNVRAASLYGQLRLGGLGLVEVVRRARLPAGARVLVVIDQFEEVFRFKRLTDPDEAEAFVKLLLQAASDPDSPVSVVLTLRSDTLGSCADFSGLPEAVSAGSFLVPRLSRNQRKEAIVKPVALRDQRIAPRLVQRLLNDVSDDYDDLPVMQHALARTWEQWAHATAGGPDTPDRPATPRRAIDLEDYEAVGGAAQALARHADEACDSLGALGGPGGAVERVFRALTERVADGVELRRPLPFKQLVAVCAGTDAGADTAAAVTAESGVRQVLERYRRTDTAFLLPGAEVPLDSNPVIDISHESLMRLWPRLRQWVAAESEARAELNRLQDDARSQAEGQGELWRGRNLARAREWQQLNQPNAAWLRLNTGTSETDSQARFKAVQAFLDRSTAAEKQELARTRRSRWGLRALAGGVVVVALIAAFNGSALQRQAKSGELAARAILALAQDPARSAHLAMLALDLDPDNDRSEYALRQAMATLEVAQAEQIVTLAAPITEARYSSDKQRVLAAGGATVWLLDAYTLATLATTPAPGDVAKAWEVGRALLVVSSSAGVHLLAHDGTVRADLSCAVAQPRPAVMAYRVTPASPATAAGTTAKPDAPAPSTPANAPTAWAQLAVGCADGQLTRWDLSQAGEATRHPLALGPAPAPPTPAPATATSPDSAGVPITALGFSADGQWLASGNADGLGLIWKRGLDGQPWIGSLKGVPAGAAKGATKSPIQHGAAIRDISFARTEPSLLASASDDRTARVWTLDLVGRHLVLANNAEIRLKHERSVSVARFVDARANADDVGPLMTVSDKRVYFWSDENTKDERPHDDWVSEASVSDDGEYLVSASLDGTARVWSSRTTVPVAVLRGHRNEVTHALFGAAGQLITTSRDRTVRRWALRAPLLLAAGRPWQVSAAIAPQGGQVLLCGEKDATRINCRLASLGLAAAAAAAAAVPASAAAVDASTSSAGSAIRKPSSGGSALAEIRNVETVVDASVSADAALALAQGGSDDLLKRHRPVLWQLASRTELKPDWLAGFALALFNPARPELLTVGHDGALAIWPQAALTGGDAAPKPLQAWGPQPGQGAAAISPDGRWIALQDQADVLLFDRRAAPQAAPWRLTGHAGKLRALSFSADGSALVSASADRTARVWRLGGLGDSAAGGAATGASASASVSASASASAKDAAKDAANAEARTAAGVPSVVLKGGHSAALTSARFSPDGAWVVTASADNSVRVWDAREGLERAALYRHAGAVAQAMFDASGEWILSVSHDGTAVLGRCDACRAPLPALRRRAQASIKLTPDDLAAVRADSTVPIIPFMGMGWFKH